MKTKWSYVCVFGLLVAPLVAIAQQKSAEMDSSKWRFPASPISRPIIAVLEAFERGEDGFTRGIIRENFSDGFRAEFAMSEHLAWFRQRHADLEGSFLPGGMLMRPSRVEIGLRADSGKRFTLSVEIEEQEPYRITGLGFETPDDATKQYADVDRSKVREITEFTHFKGVFNRDQGYVRLVTILSPT